MQVYNTFFKIILKNLNQIIIYIAVFLFFAVFLTRINASTAKPGFTETKINIAFINHDANSELVKGLKNYLDKNANIINIPDNTQKLQDALFYRQVEYIVKVPEGFTEGLVSKKNVKLEKIIVPDSTSGIYMDNLINNYLNTARIYLNNTKNLSQEQIVSCINKDLSQKTEVKMQTSAIQNSNSDNCNYYYNYLTYSLLAVMILGVGTVMMVYNNTDLKKRNLCSPLKLRSMNFQMILGNLSFAVLSWVIMTFISFVMYGSYMFTAKGLLLLLNSFIFTLAALSISYLIGNVLRSKPAMSAAANVVALGSSFICGVFVPQAFLGKTVLKIASFTPTYWYVKANNDISALSDYNMENLTPIFGNMMIVIGFAAAILAITLVMIKQRRMSN